MSAFSDRREDHLLNGLTFVTDEREADDRLGELILYIANRLGGTVPSTKLNKLLYFADFECFRRFGRPLTGAMYQRIQHGPAPKRLLVVRKALMDAKDLSLEKHEVVGGIEKRVRSLRDANLEGFSAPEIKVLDEVIEGFGVFTGKGLTKRSHDIVFDIAGEDKTPIPYEAVFISNRKIGAYEERRTGELARDLGWEHSAASPTA